jgi:hypothetical protein
MSFAMGLRISLRMVYQNKAYLEEKNNNEPYYCDKKAKIF